MHNLRQYIVPLHRYVALMDLCFCLFVWYNGELMRILKLLGEEREIVLQASDR